MEQGETSPAVIVEPLRDPFEERETTDPEPERAPVEVPVEVPVPA